MSCEHAVAERTATAAIRRAVEFRDLHCVFAGCRAPAAWCDVHHVIHWAHGGVTSCENGALLCERPSSTPQIR